MSDSTWQESAGTRADPAPAPESDGPQFRRSVGLFPAIAVNMIQICGVGPFLTIPTIVAVMNGPLAVIGWILGALLAMSDGLVWAELGAAMPGAGGTYLYVREAFQYRTGKLMPFLFVWTAMLSIPLIMSTGVIGFVQYLGFFLPDLAPWQTHAISIAVVAVVVLALYRRIESIRALSAVLWVIMVLAVGLTIAAAYSDFHLNLAMSLPPDAGNIGKFFTGLGAGLIIAIYDYAGYNTTAYMGDELKNPGRVMPRSIIVSIVAMMVFYLAMNIGVIGTVPWQDVAKSTSVASLVVSRNWGHGAAAFVTVLILIAAFASVFAGLLGGSRVPFHAARDGVFLSAFGRLHRRHDFPHVALLVMGVVTAAGTFFDLTTVINMLVAVAVLLQSVAQIAALTVLRRRQPALHRPYRQWLYPVPSLVALVGWLYVFYATDYLSQVMSTIWIALGLIAFLIWARVARQWPFGPKYVRETFLEQQKSAASH
ncbi:APC family permease [Burkholderia contaminans]|uniref:APC family permease n=1 Tax=Burkholderia contaminans TaxID=488447 RepID=UPI0009E1DE8E|nr:APC family permease [Burkholderia contaminans]MEB4636804.1 APC family permease [Burkholderia contaminans]MEB4651653.1 APC family permease [Burkholderia contaminans]MEB4661224.1 APC family permease [Burkholderia contaminans]MEB4667166.1 APC family permease [Burkholderia contaminans]MEB4678454.1 APC family permease [Burkholderia contaminans]